MKKYYRGLICTKNEYIFLRTQRNFLKNQKIFVHMRFFCLRSPNTFMLLSYLTCSTNRKNRKNGGPNT